jgi:hypothetical protein
MAVRSITGLIAVTALLGLAACGSVSAGSVSAGSVSASSAGHPASASATPASGSSAGASSAGAASASAPADTGGVSAAGSLCTDRPAADRVVVSRTPSPRQVMVSGATQVRAMVAALCALPPLSAGQPCPATSAGSVRLTFAAGTQSFSPVTVQESGCRSVTGLGTTRWWSGSAPLSLLLDEAVGGLGRLAPGTHPSSVPTGP